MASNDSTIPAGYCQCGCGRRTKVWTRNDTRRGRVKGQPMRFYPNHCSKHRNRVVPENPTVLGADGIPAGTCQCGCGRRTKIATHNNTKRGYRKGEYRPFVVGHGLYRKREETDDSPVRTCHTCKKQVPIDRMRRVRGVVIGRCKACEVIRVREWGKRHPGRKKDTVLRKKYGITLAEYKQMLREQGGKCAICRRYERKIDPRTKKAMMLAVDHPHDDSGTVRGLLCSECNRAIGLFRDNPDWLRRAAEYVETKKE